MGTPMPVVSYFRGDFLYSLVLIEDSDTVAEIARKCAEHAAGRRVPAQDRSLQVEYQGRVLDPDKAVTDEGIAAMEEVVVSYAGG
jgi:toluene monooxygenase system protein B